MNVKLEELWELFPIYLTEHQNCWSKWYEEEQNILKRILPTTKLGLQIYHIGSTAIHGIWAKPIVDILIEIPNAATNKLRFFCCVSIPIMFIFFP